MGLEKRKHMRGTGRVKEEGDDVIIKPHERINGKLTQCTLIDKLPHNFVHKIKVPSYLTNTFYLC